MVGRHVSDIFFLDLENPSAGFSSLNPAGFPDNINNGYMISHILNYQRHVYFYARSPSAVLEWNPIAEKFEEDTNHILAGKNLDGIRATVPLWLFPHCN